MPQKHHYYNILGSSINIHHNDTLDTIEDQNIQLYTIINSNQNKNHSIQTPNKSNI